MHTLRKISSSIEMTKDKRIVALHDDYLDGFAF